MTVLGAVKRSHREAGTPAQEALALKDALTQALAEISLTLASGEIHAYARVPTTPSSRALRQNRSVRIVANRHTQASARITAPNALARTVSAANAPASTR